MPNFLSRFLTISSLGALDELGELVEGERGEKEMGNRGFNK